MSQRGANTKAIGLDPTQLPHQRSSSESLTEASPSFISRFRSRGGGHISLVLIVIAGQVPGPAMTPSTCWTPQ